MPPNSIISAEHYNNLVQAFNEWVEFKDAHNAQTLAASDGTVSLQDAVKTLFGMSKAHQKAFEALIDAMAPLVG